MGKNDSLSHADRAFSILTGMMNSQVISALLRTGVIESLGQSPKSVGEIAITVNINEKVLCRTLRFAGNIGLVLCSEGKYSLTETGRLFLKEVPGSLYSSASLISAPPWRDSWRDFQHCLETGDPAFDHVFGQPFFDFLDKNLEYGKPFHYYQTLLTSRIAPAVAEAYDFSTFNTICDVGGGQGLLLKTILETADHVKGILFDLENVIKHNILDAFGSRAEIIAGSFFEKIPPADCLILKTIIHDWNDHDALRILINCNQSLSSKGRLLLVERVVEEPYDQMDLFYDLHMQVMLGGAERTEEEFRSLLSQAGFILSGIFPTRSPMKIIEATIKQKEK